MRPITIRGAATGVLAILLIAALAACGGEDEALTQADIEEIVRHELAAQETPAQGPTEAEVIAMIKTAVPKEDGDGSNMTSAQIQAAVRGELDKAPQAAVSKADVDQMIQDSKADVDQMIQDSKADVDQMIEDSMSAMSKDMDAVTMEEAKAIAQDVIASVPPRTDPEAYTRYVVDNAIRRYATSGLEATVEHYNQASSVDGQWYVFIIDENDTVISHHDSGRLGLDLNGWVGTDTNGYNFGPEMLSATGDGKWVSYVYRNPESGGLGSDTTGSMQLKNAWVVKHDGMLFASGWYIDADEFTKFLVATAARVFREVGLEGTIAYFASPEIVFGGLAAVIGYYNSAENVEGEWFAFIADSSGTIVDHYRKDMVGKSLEDVLGTDEFEATAEGNWVTTEDVRVWVLGQDGMTFGSGWHSGHDESD